MKKKIMRDNEKKKQATRNIKTGLWDEKQSKKNKAQRTRYKK